MEIDMNRSCRSCLCESNDMHPIRKSARSFDKSDSAEKDSYECNMSIAEVIMACTVVSISPDDGLPQNVCSECLHQIRQTFQFKEKCEAADLKLRHYTLNRNDPISCIKTENDETDQFFHPETVLITDFGMDSDSADAPAPVPAKVKREKKRRHNDSEVEKVAKKIKTEPLPIDADEKRIIDEAQIVDGRYQCKFCEKSLADRQTFRLHIRLHTGTNLKRCSICDRGFAKKNHLGRHMATHHEAHKCTFCTMGFATTDERDEHQMSCSKSDGRESTKVKEEFEMDNVPAGSDPPLVTRLRNRNATYDEQSEPDDDSTNEQIAKGKKTKLGEIMRTRMRIPLDEDEQRLVQSAKIVDDRFECPLCSKTLARKELLILHIRTHTGKNLLRCKVCDKGFAKPYNLNRHMLLHDNENNIGMDETLAKAVQPDGSFCCAICTKVFLERQSFRLHLRAHSGNKFRHCVVCNKTFTEETEFLEHMSGHGDADKPLSTNRPRPSKKQSNDDDDDDDDDEDEQLVNSAELVNGRYNCKFCEKTLANRSTLKLHIRLHLQKKLKKCEYCGHGFAKNSHLDRHMKTHFPKKPECKYCHATFDSVQEQKAHTVAMHPDEATVSKVRTAIIPWTQPNGKKVCQCMICDSIFDEISTLRNHLTGHAETVDWIHEVDLKSKVNFLQMFDELRNDAMTNEDIAKVLQTKLKNDSQDIVKMYRITNEQSWELSFTDSETDNECNDEENIERKPLYHCNECQIPQSFDRIHKLMTHFQAEHQGISNRFQCIHCSQCFPNPTILAKHLRQQCENAGKTLHCKMCYSRFTWESSLTKHCAVHHESELKLLGTNVSRRPFRCDLCSKAFYTEKRLNDHRLRHLPKEKRFACDICDKKFGRYDHLSVHMRSHIPRHEREPIPKTHLCSYCGIGFSYSSDLNVHIRKHTGERPYKCDICSSRFRRSCDLVCHRRTHTGERPYPCLVCGFRFSRSNKLARHMRIHTGERRYKCTECDRAFTQSNDLTLHIRRHRGDKPFNCICGDRFITNSLLQQHRRNHAH